LAKTGSSAPEILEAQLIEYKGFGEKKASKMADGHRPNGQKGPKWHCRDFANLLLVKA
jgi:hypothetical protein